MILQRKKPEPKCPIAPPPLTEQEAVSILNGPNGRNVLRAFRVGQHDAAQAATRTIDKVLGEVQA